MTLIIIIGICLFLLAAFIFRTKIIVITVELIGMFITFLLSDFTTPIAVNFVDHSLNSPSLLNEQLTKFGSWIVFEFVYYIFTNMLLKKIGANHVRGESHKEHKKREKEFKHDKHEKHEKHDKKHENKEKTHVKTKESKPIFVPIIKFMVFGMIFLIIASLVTNVIPSVDQIIQFPLIKQLNDIVGTVTNIFKN